MDKRKIINIYYMNNTIPILLATSGKFDINTNYLPYINPSEIRYNKKVIDYFNL